MELTGQYRIPAPRQKVWEALNDPDVLKECIPGCKSLEKGDDETMSATVVAKIGPVKATFKGDVRLENLNPPESYSIVGEGKGGVAGFAKGGADVKLTEDGADTILDYEAKAQVGGKLAQLGSRLVDSTARKMADDFFGAFSQKVGGEATAAPEAAAPQAADAEEPAPADAAPEAAAAPAAPSPAPAPAAQTPASKPTDQVPGGEQQGGLAFSGPMLWIMVGAAAIILILAIAL